MNRFNFRLDFNTQVQMMDMFSIPLLLHIRSLGFWVEPMILMFVFRWIHVVLLRVNNMMLCVRVIIIICFPLKQNLTYLIDASTFLVTGWNTESVWKWTVDVWLVVWETSTWSQALCWFCGYCGGRAAKKLLNSDCEIKSETSQRVKIWKRVPRCLFSKESSHVEKVTVTFPFSQLSLFSFIIFSFSFFLYFWFLYLCCLCVINSFFPAFVLFYFIVIVLFFISFLTYSFLWFQFYFLFFYFYLRFFFLYSIFSFFIFACIFSSFFFVILSLFFLLSFSLFIHF